MANNLAESLRRSKRVQIFPPDLTPVIGERTMEVTNQGATVDSHVEENPAVEVGE